MKKITVTKYRADDGSVWDTEQEAKRRDRECRERAVKKVRLATVDIRLFPSLQRDESVYVEVHDFDNRLLRNYRLSRGEAHELANALLDSVVPVKIDNGPGYK